jgi:hypothetical protein
MKYFTPELIARGQSEDSRILDEVEARWDELCDQYNAYIGSIKEEFPPGLRHIEDSYYLHDAKVQGMGQRDGVLVVVLQLDTPPHSLLTFTYELVEEPRIDPEALPEPVRSRGNIVEWQYDEIEKVAGPAATWKQSILLSNGWEVALHFRDVKVEEAQALLPAPRNGAAGVPASAVPQTAS